MVNTPRLVAQQGSDMTASEAPPNMFMHKYISNDVCKSYLITLNKNQLTMNSVTINIHRVAVFLCVLTYFNCILMGRVLLHSESGWECLTVRLVR